MPPATQLTRPVSHYSIMTSSDASKGCHASRVSNNRGAKMLRIPGPCLPGAAEDSDSKAGSGHAISADSSGSVNLSTVDIRSLLRNPHPLAAEAEDSDGIRVPQIPPASIEIGSVEPDPPVFADSETYSGGKCTSSVDCDSPRVDVDNSHSGSSTVFQGSRESAPPSVQGSEIVPVLKRKGSLKDKSRESGARTVSLSEPPNAAPDSDPAREHTRTSSASSTTTNNGDDPKASSDSATMVPKRRISFPADSVLTAVIQDGDTPELVRILTGRHGPGVVVPNRGGQRGSGERRGVDVRQTNHVGLTALHHAVLANNLDAAKLLLCHGADVNAQDVHGFSPLHTAAACGSVPLTSLLVLFGADVFSQTLDQELPIDVAKELRVVRVLSGEMTRLVHRELWVASLLRARAEEAWLLARKVLACVLLLVLHVCLCIRTSWRKHRKSD